MAFSWQENGGALASELEGASMKLSDEVGIKILVGILLVHLFE